MGGDGGWAADDEGHTTTPPRVRVFIIDSRDDALFMVMSPASTRARVRAAGYYSVAIFFFFLYTRCSNGLAVDAYRLSRCKNMFFHCCRGGVDIWEISPDKEKLYTRCEDAN